LFAVLEDIGHLTWTPAALKRFEQRIIEVSVWRDIMFPLSFSTRGIHHTLLHLAQCIRRHGPAPCWWNYSSERYAGTMKRMLHSFKSLEVGILLSHAVRYEATLREAVSMAEPAAGAAGSGTVLRSGLVDTYGRSTAPGVARMLPKGSSTVNLAPIVEHLSVKRMNIADKRANTFFPAAVTHRQIDAPAPNSNLARDFNNTHSLLKQLIRYTLEIVLSANDSVFKKLAKKLERDCRQHATCPSAADIYFFNDMWSRSDPTGKKVKTQEEEIFYSGFNTSVETFSRMYINGVLYRTKSIEEALSSQSSGGRVSNERGGAHAKRVWSYCIVEKIIRWRIFNHPSSPVYDFVGVTWLNVESGVDAKTRSFVASVNPTHEDNISRRIILASNLEPVNVQRVHASGAKGTSAEKFFLVTIPRSIKHKEL
jgi:hypothetical protein